MESHRDGLPGRIAFEEPDALNALRTETFERVGADCGAKILYGIGLLQGLVDGLSLRRSRATSHARGERVGSAIRMIFTLDGGDLDGCFSGSLHDSTEAALHRRTQGESDVPVCSVTAGYAAGWFSALLGNGVLVREVACVGGGAATCRFEARPLDDWITANDPWAEALLPYVDLSALHERAVELVSAGEEDEPEGSMMGGFDSMSPAIHVWGPVMIIPYSGFEDSDAAVDMILADLGSTQIEVAIVDLTGARIETIETLGVLQLANELTARKIETILVGLNDQARGAFLAQPDRASTPLECGDVSEAIALAFQVASAGRGAKV